MLWAKIYHCIIHLYLYNIQKLKCRNDNCLAIFVHFSPLGSYGTYQFISVYLVYFNLIRSNLVHLQMALKPQAQKGPYELMDNQFLKLAQSAQIIFKFKIIKKKKKKNAPIISCIYSLSQIYFFLFLYLCLFSTQLIILGVQSNWIRNG